MKFESRLEYVGGLTLPKFTGIRVMMMPIILGDLSSIPNTLGRYRKTLRLLFGRACDHLGKVGYITIDEKLVKAGQTHRRAGLHVDGVYNGSVGAWGGDGGGGWGAPGTGMLTVSNIAGCKAYKQTFQGMPGPDGECDHLKAQCDETKAVIFKPGHIYWVDGLCVHESMPMTQDVERQFVRLSMPSTAPWFQGYTENPLGVKPTGPILAPRKYMAA